MKNRNISNGSYYRSLTRKMVMVTILVSITPLVMISGLIGYQFHTSYQEKVIDHLKEVVEKHKQNIDSFLYERLANIQMIVRSYPYERLVDESFLRERLSILRDEYKGVFVDLGIVNEQGLQVAYAGPFELRWALYREAEWFKYAMKMDFYISDVFLGLRGTPHFIITVKQEGANWLLRATIDFDAFTNLVEGIHIGRTGFAFILNRKGEYQTSPRLKETPAPGFYSDLINETFRSQKSIVFRRGMDHGRNSIFVMTPLKNGEWILIFQQDEADAFEELYRARRLAFSIVILGGLGIVAMAIVLSRRMVSRIARSDREKEMMNEQVIEAGKLASLGELAAGIAHEINNPVAIMVEEAGWVGDLLEEEEFRECKNLGELKRAVEQIRNQGKRCKEITHKLLSFARKTDPTPRNVKLNDLIEEVVGLSEQRARFSNVKIETHLDPSLPTISVSPSEIQQVLLNLINNALDAMDKEGGRIDITTRLEGNHIVLDVADTGHGIPKANLPRIFDPFFTTKPVGKGTGLGLSICYGIIKKMGGEISVNSALGVGTTFHIYIPLKTKRAL